MAASMLAGCAGSDARAGHQDPDGVREAVRIARPDVPPPFTPRRCELQPVDRNSSALQCARCGADADLPSGRIDYRDQADIVNGRYRLPELSTWYRDLTPRALFGKVRPVPWEHLDVTDGLAACAAAASDRASEVDRVPYGRLLHKSGDLVGAADQFETELEALRGRTTTGVRRSATYLGRMYEMGWGRSRDLARAAELYELGMSGETAWDNREVASPWHPRALHNLASMHFWGNGIDQNHALSAKLWLEAARLHQVHSVANVAWLLRRGLGLPKDAGRSADLYLTAIRRLSLREDAPDLLVANEDRFGVFHPDKSTSASWLDKAAAAGQREALATLGFLYHTGRLVTRDLDRALDYYERAIALYGLTPEYSPGPAFVTKSNASPHPIRAAWVVDKALLDAGVSSGDPFALVMRGIYLERIGRSADNATIRAAARDDYERSGLANARHRAATLLLDGAAPGGDRAEAERLLQVAATLLTEAAGSGNPSAQFDLATVWSLLGERRRASSWLQRSAAAVRDDFYHPDVRPLIAAGIELDSHSVVEQSADAIGLFDEAARRAAFSGRVELMDTISAVRQVARERYRVGMKELAARLQTERTARNAAALVLVFAALAGMGGGGQTGGGYMDMSDPIQFWGAMIMIR
jgi:TPR repeat protein